MCLLAESSSFAEYIEFLELYEQRPMANNQFGLRSVGMFWLWKLIRQVAPDFVVESGVWRGQGTWMIEKAASKAELLCIEPNLDKIRYRSPAASYIATDFMDIEDLPHDKRLLCVFDDHQDAYVRVVRCSELGIKYLIFDDNYPVATGNHLSLCHCFQLERHRAKADHLSRLIKTYSVMPQIIGQQPVHAPSSIWNSLEEIDISVRDRMKLFADEKDSYSWITFVELN